MRTIERFHKASERDHSASSVSDIRDHAERLDRLKLGGYAPLMRYGRETVYVIGPNGEQQYFGMFDRAHDANRMARLMHQQYPNSQIECGTIQVHSRVREMALGQTTRILKSAPKELRGGVAEALR